MHLIHRDEVFPDGADVASERLRVASGRPAHGHDFLELVLVHGGAGTHESAGGVRRLCRGSLVVMRPGEWHGYPAADRLDVTNVYVASALLGSELTLLHRCPPVGSVLAPTTADPRVIPADRVGELEVLTARLTADAATSTSTGRVRRLGLLLCLLAGLAEALPGEAGPAGERGREPAEAFVSQAAAAMAADPARGWTVAELAARAHVSRGHLSRSFTRQLGLAPMSWLARLRGERAAALLVETDLPVAVIGRQVGWSDPNYTSRRFRQVLGVSPAVYRRRFAR